MTVPAAGVHRPDRGQPSGRSSTPSVTAAGVKECPLPVIRIVRPSSAARAISAATSAAEPGEATRRGLAVTLPAQLCQVCAGG